MLIVFTITEINNLVEIPFYVLLAGCANVAHWVPSLIWKVRILVKDTCDNTNKNMLFGTAKSRSKIKITVSFEGIK